MRSSSLQFVGIVVMIALSHLSLSQSVIDSVRLVVAKALTSFVVGGATSSTEVVGVGERFRDSSDRGVATAFVMESRRPTKGRSVTTSTPV